MSPSVTGVSQVMYELFDSRQIDCCDDSLFSFINTLDFFYPADYIQLNKMHADRLYFI